MWPRVGFNKPNTSLTVVDLPEPLGPSKPKTSPRRTSKSTLSTARAFGRFQKSLKTLVSPRTETMTSADFGFPLDAWGFNSATGMLLGGNQAILGVRLPAGRLVEPWSWPCP